MSESVKNVVDAGALTITVGTVMDILPSIAALVTILWTLIRIYETKTVQNILQKVLGDGT